MTLTDTEVKDTRQMSLTDRNHGNPVTFTADPPWICVASVRNPGHWGRIIECTNIVVNSDDDSLLDVFFVLERNLSNSDWPQNVGPVPQGDHTAHFPVTFRLQRSPQLPFLRWLSAHWPRHLPPLPRPQSPHERHRADYSWFDSHSSQLNSYIV